MSDAESGRRIKPLHVLGLLILLGGGVYGYLQLTRGDRLLAELDSRGWNPTAFAEAFPQLPLDDPRVAAGCVKVLQSLAEFPFPSDESAEGQLALVFQAFSARGPEPSPELFDSLARLHVSLGDARCLERLAGADDAVVRESLLREAALRLPKVAFLLRGEPEMWDPALVEDQRRRWARAADELERREYAGAAEHAQALTQLWIRCGFPRAREWLLAACDEAQAAQALRTELIELADQREPHPGPLRKQLRVLLPELAARGVSVDDEYLEALTKAWSSCASPECAAALREQLGGQRAQVLKHIEPEPLLKLQVLGGAPADVGKVLDLLAAADPDPEDLQGHRPPTDYYGDLREGYGGFSAEETTLKYFHTLVALGPASVPQLLEGYERAGPSSVIEVAAAALATIDPAALIEHIQHALAGSHELEAGKAAIARGLRALEKLRGHEADFCFMFCLSSTDEVIATYSAEALEERLERAELVDTLFRFLAHKGRFNWNEWITYQNALVRHDTPVTPDIVRNLEALLSAADGDPEQVFWIHKVIGIRALRIVGDEACYPILAAYAADPGGYVQVKEGEQQAEEEVLFRQLCRDALAEIAERTGQAAPELPGAGGN